MSVPPKCGDEVLLPPRYLGPVSYFAAIAAHRKAVVVDSMRFDKRCKDTHRCIIADTHGPVRLTVPIEKPVSMTAARWSDIVISAHDAWWHQHWVSLQSAYGRTPFFEYYVDDFARFFTAEAAGRRLTDWLHEIDRTLLRLLQIDTEVRFGSETDGGPGAADWCRGIPAGFRQIPEYYQVRQQKFGFLPDMSVVDLLFNMGPEAALVLDRIVGAVRASSMPAIDREYRAGSAGGGV